MESYLDKAKVWMGDGFDPETRAAVAALLKDDPAQAEDAFYKNLEFGTGGLRSVMGVGTNRMNRYTVGMATQGLANYINATVDGGKSVCISYDSRNNSRLFAEISAKVLSNNGIKVYMFDGIRPTPLLSYSIRAKGATAGIMITASHNPKEYNGYKVFWSDGGQVVSPVDREIVAEVGKISDPSQVKFESDGPVGGIELMGEEMDEAYVSEILALSLSPEALSRQASNIRIVYTPLHGCGVKLVPEVLSRLGFDKVYHVPSQDVPDGNFPTVVSPNPEEPAAMELALAKAEETGADIVLATDPDADRLGVAVRDDSGKMVRLNGNQTASILTRYILGRKKELGLLGPEDFCVKTIVTTPLIADICKRYGVKCFDVLTGFKYIAAVIKDREGIGSYICGGEESYGFSVGDFVRDKCAQSAAAMVAECAAWAADRGLTLWGLLREIYAEYGLRREEMVYIVRKGKAGAEEIAARMASYREDPPKEIAGTPVEKVIDYTRPDKTGLPSSNVLQFVSVEGDTVSVRPSGTEPKIKFYFATSGPDAVSKVEALKSQFLG